VTPDRAEHLRDEADFVRQAAGGTLPAVSFVKPPGAVNEHPGYSDIVNAERHVVALIDAIRNIGTRLHRAPVRASPAVFT
jgi:hypothetical protein